MTDKNQTSSESLARTEQLIWMLLDDVLPEEELPKLEAAIQADEQCMQLYLDCVQLHADLFDHHQPPKKIELPDLPASPVLGSLSDPVPGIDAGSPVTGS